MSRLGAYDHLNCPPSPPDNDRGHADVNVPISMEHLAQKLERMNYGTHRFLSALVRVRKQSSEITCREYNMLTDAIEKAIEAGGF